MQDPISALSLGLGLMFGTAGLPHILMRFFTVSDAREARKSVFYATGFMGYFYILTFIIGFGAIMLVGANPAYKDAAGALIGGNNMAAVHLANAVGGNLFLGFISAVAFATILAVVAGLTLAGASAVSHDLYANVFRKGATEREELKVSKITVTVLGVIAIILGVLFENQNIAFMVGGICYRRELQLPHHSAFHVLVKTDHARRYAGRLVRFTDSGGADDSWPYHLGADPRPRKSDLPV